MDIEKLAQIQQKKYQSNLLYKDEVYSIIGAAFEVHTVLGSGFLEPVYQEALAIEFTNKKIPYQQQKELEIYYKDHKLVKKYIADFVLFERIICEIKSEIHLTVIDEAQVINYLKATGFQLGLLINFGSKQMEWKRYINTKR